MKAQFWNISSVFSGLVLIAGLAAQVNGQVTGDGTPDLYYFQGPGDSSVMTSMGLVTRPAGTLLLDSDRDAAGSFVYDIAAVLVSGPDVSLPGGNTGCDICNGYRLPTGSSTGSPVAGADITVGFAAGSTQWIRTNPLSGVSYRGVVGTGWVRNTASNTVIGSAAAPVWPTDVVDPDAPEPPDSIYYGVYRQGLARYAPGLTDAAFPKIFNDGLSDALWSVRLAADTLAPIYTNVTIVPGIPEPTSGLLGAISLAFIGLVRRHVG